MAETAQVTGPGASSSSSSSSSSKSSHTSTVGNGNGLGGGNGLGNGSSIPVGPLPALNNEASSLIGAPGNASGLFPQISPSDSPSPAPGAGSRAGNAKADPSVSLLPLGMPVVTAQVVGLIALAVALMLAMTRISLRRRPAGANGAGPGNSATGPDKTSTPKRP
ncbi:MAG: hypothetical protein JO345_39005 [Streptosporangiaceae bacterium]|nr:hypothetical protein [Streptosporangiaceae bacterium]